MSNVVDFKPKGFLARLWERVVAFAKNERKLASSYLAQAIKEDMTKEEFRSQLDALCGHLSDIEVARLLRLSVPTIVRWRHGISAPHPLARRGVIRRLQVVMGVNNGK